MTVQIEVAAHPLLALSAFVTTFSQPLSQCPTAEALRSLLSKDAEAPLRADDALRTSIRALLRHGGFKPSGRSKPASEYLVRAIEEGALDSINVAVDACNVVSYHSGIPISVVDFDRVREPLRIEIARAGERYIFNASGQEMDLAGLLCLFDAEGPCANAVKDSQRTKTHDGTQRTLSILWGTQSHRANTDDATRWYRVLLAQAGAATDSVTLQSVTRTGVDAHAP